MKLSFGTVAPTFAILATALGLLYSYFVAPSPLDQPKPSGLEVTEAMLNPTLLKLPDRDPFRLSPEFDSKPLTAVAMPTYGASSSAANPSAPAAPGQAPAATRRSAKAATPSEALGALTARARGWAEALRRRADAALAIRSDLKAKVEGKANLSCISINARRKLAIINGRAYAEGDPIDWAAGLAGPIFVAEVRAASVLLRSEGAEHEVRFPHSSKPTAAMASVGPSSSGLAKKSKASRKAAAVKAR